jgi:hypothetical protein
MLFSMRRNSLSFTTSLLLGAAVMYLLDPVSGRRRRALLRDQTVRLVNDCTDWCTGLTRDLRNRASGVRARLRPLDQGVVDDEVLEARVRTALGRATSHPGAIDVISVNGIVTLTGPVLANEHDAIWRAVSRVAGVQDVIDQLTLHESAGSIPALQGGAPVV